MSFLKEVFGPKSLIEDVRATIIGMMTGGAVLFFGSIGGAIWKSIKEQPIPWTVLILIGVAGISLLLGATIKLVKSGIAEQPHPVTPIAPMVADSVPMIPPTPDFSDPAYDQFFERVFPSTWRESLVKKGQPLVEQWTMRLEYPEKQRREHDSKNWLGEANEFAKKHLTSEQINEFMLRHSIATSGGKKYEFAMALTQAGTVPSSEDGNLAFEIFGKIKLLERFRNEKKKKNELKKDSVKPTFPDSNKTPIELIAEALAEGEKIERFCEGLNDGNECQHRVNAWVENTKGLLRASVTDYFAIFYEALEKQYTGALCPHPDPQHPKEMVAVSQWYADKERLEAWQMIRKCLDALYSIKKKLRATLPS